MDKDIKTIECLEKELIKLRRSGNKLYNEQMLCYGQLRGFRKNVSILLQDELDGGELRNLNVIETNTYKMPR
jgi:hypothetical protein